METSAQITGAWILVGVYAIVIIFLVFRGAAKTRNITDYALGNLFFHPVAVGLSLAASMTSAATFVINPGFIANFGISGVISYGLVLPIAAVTSLVLLTKNFRKYGQSTRALTLAQWIGNRYKSKGYAFFMAMLTLLLVTFIVLIVVALTKVLSKALNVNELYVMIAVVVFVFGYMMFGGANSMVYTNTVQALIMLGVALVLLTSGHEHFSNGIRGFLAKISEIDPLLIQPTNPNSPLFRNWYEIIFAQIVVGIAIVVQPHIITKSLLLRNENDVNKFLTTAVVVQLIFFFVVLSGLYARIMFPDLIANGVMLSNDEIIPAYVVSAFADSPIGLIVGLFVVLGLISAGMSTLEGLVQSVSTTITSDIVKPLFRHRQLNDRQLITINKLAIVFLAVATIWLSYGQLETPRLSVGIFAQNGVYAYFSAAFIPVIFGLFLKNIRFHAPLYASITAIAVHFTVYYIVPELMIHYDLNLGFLNVFMTGHVRNPAIASSTAIIASSVVGFTMYLLQRIKMKNDPHVRLV